MSRMAVRPTIDINRIPSGEREFEEVMADVFLHLIEKNMLVLSSVERIDTLVKSQSVHYNLDNSRIEEDYNNVPKS